MTNITEYKTRKKVKLVHKELLEVVKILNEAAEKLKKYSKYIPVVEVVQNLANNKTVIEIHVNKFKRIIDDK